MTRDRGNRDRDNRDRDKREGQRGSERKRLEGVGLRSGEIKYEGTPPYSEHPQRRFCPYAPKESLSCWVGKEVRLSCQIKKSLFLKLCC